LIFVSLIQFLSQPNPLPCFTLTLQAPSHAEVVLKTTP
jgi:hypothetical protein